MAFKRYNLVDNGYLQLANSINSSIGTINIYFPTTYNWNKTLPTNNWIGTLVKYGVDGNPSKMEKVYVTATSGTTLTVTRGYLGDGAQSFDADDYLFLNVVAENLDDIHTRIDEVELDKQNQLTDIYNEGTRRLRIYRLTGDSVLQVRIGSGTYRVGDVEGNYAGGTLTVANNVTTYIMINSSGVIQTSTSSWNTAYTRLGKVVSSGGLITSITLWRNDAVGGPISGKGIPNMGSVAIGTPLSYATQIITGPEYRPQLVAGGVGYVGITGMDSIVSYWTVITYGSYTDGVNTIQVAYSNSTTDGKVYQFMRKGSSNTVWSAWTQVTLDISYLSAVTTLATTDEFVIDNGTDNKKITKENLERSIFVQNGAYTAKTCQSGPSAAVINTSASSLVTGSTIGRAVLSISTASGFAHKSAIQTSPDNSTWTNLYEIVGNSVTSRDLTFIMKGGLYYRTRTETVATGGGEVSIATLTYTV